jgi:hypothetical protein
MLQLNPQHYRRANSKEHSMNNDWSSLQEKALEYCKLETRSLWESTAIISTGLQLKNCILLGGEASNAMGYGTGDDRYRPCRTNK